MEMENLFILMEIFIKDNGKMENIKVKENYVIQMVQNIKVIGKMI